MNGPLCGVELAFDAADLHPERGIRIFGEYTPKASICFSSEPKRGVRFRYVDISSPFEWHLLDIPAEDWQVTEVLDACILHLGMRYDRAGAAGFLLPRWLHVDDYEDWFPSEAVNHVLVSGGLLQDPATEKGYKICPDELRRLIAATL